MSERRISDILYCINHHIDKLGPDFETTQDLFTKYTLMHHGNINIKKNTEHANIILNMIKRKSHLNLNNWSKDQLTKKLSNTWKKIRRYM